MRIIGFFISLIGSLAIIGELKGIAFPTARWFFNTSREVPWLHSGNGAALFPWFGWIAAVLLVVAGVMMMFRSFGRVADPVMARRMARFRSLKRGYFSLLILIGLCGLAALDQAVVGKRAIAIRHNGEWKFPAFLPYDLRNRDFGIEGERAGAPADYRIIKRNFAAAGGEGLVIMPLVPYDPTGDTLPPRSRAMEKRDDLYHESGSDRPYYGLAGKYYDVAEARLHLRFTLRKGLLSGPVDGWDEKGSPVYNASYREGELLSESYTGPGTKEDFLAAKSSDFRAVKYHPAPPMPGEGNFLGTTSQGYDVLAYLFGGLQINFKAALIYLPVTYLIGITIGLLMGYFGGWFDLVVYRIIEILSNVPFLFVIIILASLVPENLKGLPVILPILMFFGWIGVSTLMRTAAYRDKARDYVAAARVLGAGTPRILVRHLLPNTVSIIVTLVPFSMSGLIFSLTALDYLGFGLPPEHATWGRLLNDGLANLSAPWLATASFVALVSLLVLITFIGEAVREAFDPKRFTYYR